LTHNQLVNADGRSTSSLGLGLKEEADVAKSLGRVEAINVDGGKIRQHRLAGPPGIQKPRKLWS